MTEIKASTQEHLDVETIKNDLVVLKNGNVTALLETDAVNFDLLSEREQEATIAAYGGILNSLSFPIQILMHSRKLNLQDYLKSLKEKKKNREKSRRDQIDAYTNFIENLAEKNEVLTKRFYVAIPYKGVVVAEENPLQTFIYGVTGKEKKEKKLPIKKLLKNAEPKLEPRVDHLIKQFGRLGIQARRLKGSEIMKLLFEFYNEKL